MLAHDEWKLLPQRVALHRPTATVVAADLHLGYAEARRRAGEAIPLTPLLDDLASLRAAVECGAKQIVLAGDVYEQLGCGPSATELRACLQQIGLELSAVVPGNHEDGWQESGLDLPWQPEGHPLGDWLVLHGDGRLPRRPVVHGHFHPALPVAPHGLLPCFLVAAQRLVLPAFSRDAAGVSIQGEPRWRGLKVHAIGGESVVELGVWR